MELDYTEIKQKIDSIIDGFCLDYKIDNLRKESGNVWNACLQLIGEQIFRTTEKQKNQRKSIIDYNDMQQLEDTYKLYKFLCGIYNKEVNIYGYSLFIGCSKNTLYTWLNSECQSIVYIDNKLNEPIKDLDTYRLLNKGDMSNTTEILTTSHSDFVKNILKDNENSLSNIGIGDRNNTGVAMKLNTKFGWNSSTGLENQEKKAQRVQRAGLLPNSMNLQIDPPKT